MIIIKKALVAGLLIAKVTGSCMAVETQLHQMHDEAVATIRAESNKAELEKIAHSHFTELLAYSKKTEISQDEAAIGIQAAALCVTALNKIQDTFFEENPLVRERVIALEAKLLRALDAKGAQ